jgi:hypothetical protein
VLRRQGLAIRRIAATLGVSPSTVSAWVRDIPLTEEQARALRASHQGPDAVARRTSAWSRLCRRRRELAQAEGRAAARIGDPLHLTGCMLYWAEGAKDRNQLSFANSDPAMVRTFCRFLRESLRIPDERITIRVNAYTGGGLDPEAIEAHWLSVCGLPRTQLRKSVFDYRPVSSRGLRERKLPYGVCTVKVTRSTAIVQHIYGAIQEYAAFDEPRWLD